MRIVLATSGSRGDVQPMVALSLALQAAGHRVMLLGPPEKTGWARQLGCPYTGLGRDVTAFINTMGHVLDPRAQMGFVSFVRQEVRTQFRSLPRALEGADLAVGASLVFGLSSVAQALDIPYRYVAFTAQLFPSSCHPFMTVKCQNLPAWCNRGSWRLAAWLDRLNMTRILNQYRKRAKLAPVGNAWAHILGRRPVLACDRAVAGVPADAGRVVQTGALHLMIADPEDPDLAAFLARGGRPVYAGFGSMPPKDQDRIAPMVIQAARCFGRRVVIRAAGPLPQAAGRDIFQIRNYPHQWLFPKMAAVIHHGGAGTTAAAVRAGVPQVIVPHILDQYYHAEQIRRSGLGPASVWRSRLTPNRLAAALGRALKDPGIRANALEAGRRIDPARSLALTVQTLEHSLSMP